MNTMVSSDMRDRFLVTEHIESSGGEVAVRHYNDTLFYILSTEKLEYYKGLEQRVVDDIVVGE